jgi:hypothetical protein
VTVPGASPCDRDSLGSRLRNWRAYQITGTKVLKVNAYIR